MRKGLRPELALESAEGLLAYLGQALPKEVLDRASRLALLGEVDEEEGAFLLPYAEDLLLERREGRICFHPLVRSALKALLPEGEARARRPRASPSGRRALRALRTRGWKQMRPSRLSRSRSSA